MTLEQFDHICRAAGRPKDFEFACAVAPLFPMNAAAQQKLRAEFEEAHPELSKIVQENLQHWQTLMHQHSPAQS